MFNELIDLSDIVKETKARHDIMWKLLWISISHPMFDVSEALNKSQEMDISQTLTRYLYPAATLKFPDGLSCSQSWYWNWKLPSWRVMCCTVLYCTVLYCTVLYWTELNWTELNCTWRGSQDTVKMRMTMVTSFTTRLLACSELDPARPAPPTGAWRGEVSSQWLSSVQCGGKVEITAEKLTSDDTDTRY